MKNRPPLSLAFVILLILVYRADTKSIANTKSPSLHLPPPTKGPPTLNEVADKMIFAHARDNVELKCPIGSDPPSIYEWYKGVNEAEIINDSWDRFDLYPNDPHLKIRSVTHEDSGTFTCKAINGFGQLTSRIQLSIIGDDPFKDNLLKSSTSKRSNYNGSYTSPEIVKDQLPKDRVLRKSKGENLSLKCEAKGNPRPTVTWLKDNQYLLGSRDNVSSLKLVNMSEESSGLYKCEASNIFGKSIYEVQVEVTGSWIGKAEILELSPTNLTLFPGESGNITCVARFESESHPMFVWVKKLSEKPDPDSKNIVYHENEPYEVLSRPEWNEKEKYVFTTDLILTNVSRADTGSYHCVVYGLMGYIHSEAQVFVQNDPAQLESVKLNKEKGIAVQWTILWGSAFLIVAIMIVTCFVRIHGCRGKPKRVPVIRTPVPKKSPGETMSTMLTQHNEPCHGLGDDNLTISSSSTSAKRVARSHHSSSGLSGLPESDVSDVLLHTRPSRTRHTKSNPYPDVHSYRFFPKASHQRNDYLPEPSGARGYNHDKKKRHRNLKSHSRKRYEDFSDFDVFPSSASACCQPNVQELGHYTCSSSSMASSTDPRRALKHYSLNYYQPPSSPVSSRTNSNNRHYIVNNGDFCT